MFTFTRYEILESIMNKLGLTRVDLTGKRFKPGTIAWIAKPIDGHFPRMYTSCMNGYCRCYRIVIRSNGSRFTTDGTLINPTRVTYNKHNEEVRHRMVRYDILEHMMLIIRRHMSYIENNNFEIYN